MHLNFIIKQVLFRMRCKNYECGQIFDHFCHIRRVFNLRGHRFDLIWPLNVKFVSTFDSSSFLYSTNRSHTINNRCLPHLTQIWPLGSSFWTEMTFQGIDNIILRMNFIFAFEWGIESYGFQNFKENGHKPVIFDQS